MNREQIIDMALELIRQREAVQGVNLREIARELSCAHTNLYNYFDDYGSLLWAALDEAARRMLVYVKGDGEARQPLRSPQDYFGRYIDFFLQHKGWFRLMWSEPLPLPRPERSAAVGIEIRDHFLALLGVVLNNHRQDRLAYDDVFYVMHTLHCYIYGEIMIYISQRGLIKDEEEFRSYVLDECLAMLPLLLERRSGGNFTS